jgi:hypothetical protein
MIVAGRFYLTCDLGAVIYEDWNRHAKFGNIDDVPVYLA